MNTRKSYYEYSKRGIFLTSLRAQELLAAHASGLGVMEVADALRISRNAANTALVRLRQAGIVDRIGLATYRLIAKTVIAPPPCVIETFIRPISKERMMAGR